METEAKIDHCMSKINLPSEPVVVDKYDAPTTIMVLIVMITLIGLDLSTQYTPYFGPRGDAQ